MGAFNIRRNDRAFFVGASGSGKTTLAKSLLWDKPYIVVLDPKRTFTLPESWPRSHTTISSIGEADAVDDDRTIIYRPSYEDNQDKANDFFQWIFTREDTLIYVDEVLPIVPNNRIGYWYARCIQEGREKGIGVWSATQRPAAVPLVTLTESEHYFVFNLRNPDDRKRMGDFGDDRLRIPVQHKNGFYYYNAEGGNVRYYKQANVGKVL